MSRCCYEKTDMLLRMPLRCHNQQHRGASMVNALRGSGRASSSVSFPYAALLTAAAVGGAALTVGVACLWPQLIEEYAGIRIVVKKVRCNRSRGRGVGTGSKNEDKSDKGGGDAMSAALRDVIQHEISHQVHERVNAMNKAHQAAGWGGKVFPPTATLPESQRMRVAAPAGN